MGITAEDRKRVKGEGFLSNRDGVHFSGRILTENGVLTAQQVQNLSEAAQKFGDGTLAFTSRLTVELPGIAFEDIEPFKAHVAKAGLETGGTGAKVRPVVACKGTVCVFGLIDTQALAKRIHDRFYEGYRAVTLPHKFKIAVGGCPNNCVKPDLNDLGITGQRVPIYDPAKCRACKVCGVSTECPMGAAVLKENGLALDPAQCNACGRCVGKCPFGAVQGSESTYLITIGGRWGKQVRHGSPLQRRLNEQQAMDMIEKCILLFKRDGLSGERFGSMIDRIGLQKVEALLYTDELLAQKDQILGIETQGGATC